MKSSHPDQYDLVFDTASGTTRLHAEEMPMLEIVENGGSPARLKVFGVGGGGSNAVNRMIQAGLRDVEFWVSNTDLQALELSPCRNRLPIGKSTTRGLGAGGDPEIGRLSAEEDATEIETIIDGADMIFVTAGMGGGTGTGAAPVVARIARELGVLTVGIVTKPFSFEGKKKAARAARGLAALAEHVDTLIAIPNDKLMHIVAPGTSFDDALLMADDVLLQATRGISDLIMGHGIINLDFADVRTVMRGRGNALLGSGASRGERRALEAAQKAVSSPLLEDLSISGAEAVLVNIQGGPSMGFHEAAQAAQFVSDQVGEEADVFWGAVIDPELGDEMRVTLVATGFPGARVVVPGAALAAPAVTPAVSAMAETTPSASTPAVLAEAEEVARVIAAKVSGESNNRPATAPAGEARPTRASNSPAESNGGNGRSGSGAGRDVSRDAVESGRRLEGASGGGFNEPKPAERPLPGVVAGATNGGVRTPGESREPQRSAQEAQGTSDRQDQRQDRGPAPRGTGRGGEVREAREERPTVETRGGEHRGGENRVSEGRGSDGRPGRSEGGRLPERERRSPSESIALGAAGLENELFLPRDRVGGSDPGLRKSRWASADPDFTEGDELDRASTKRRPLDVPTYLRRRMD